MSARRLPSWTLFPAERVRRARVAATRFLAGRTVRVGLSIGDDGQVHLIGVTRGRVRWTAADQLDPAAPLEQALPPVLTRHVRPHGDRVVSVALSGSRVQVKPLAGLPEAGAPALLSRAVQEGVGRYFLRSGAPLLVGRVRPDRDGTVWAAAYDAAAAAAVHAACTAAGCRLARVLPSVMVLPHALAGPRAWWREGTWRLELAIEAGRVVEIRHLAATETSAEAFDEPALPSNLVGIEPDCVPELASLGADGAAFAAAYGAAVAPPDEPLSLIPGREFGDDGPPTWRLAMAVTAAAVALGAALLLPALRDLRAAEHARAELASLASRRASAVVTETELHRVTTSLATLDGFVAARWSATALLAAFADALPERAALASLRVDGAGGTATVVGQQAAALVGGLRRTPSLTDVELVGAVTREPITIVGFQGAPIDPSGSPWTAAAGMSEEFERATVRFRFVTSQPASRRRSDHPGQSEP